MTNSKQSSDKTLIQTLPNSIKYPLYALIPLGVLGILGLLVYGIALVIPWIWIGTAIVDVGAFLFTTKIGLGIIIGTAIYWALFHLGRHIERNW